MFYVFIELNFLASMEYFMHRINKLISVAIFWYVQVNEWKIKICDMSPGNL
jgi:hypothetical protein